jgi:hypothetical protein
MPMTDDALEGLLVEARGLNIASGITGVLLCNDRSFVQCFEGTSAAVDVTWDRIRGSRRHKDVYELMNEAVRQCSFPAWEMGFRRAATSDLLSLSTAHWESMSRLASSGESAGFQLLQEFWFNTR